jgi:hypothetical protein
LKHNFEKQGKNKRPQQQQQKKKKKKEKEKNCHELGFLKIQPNS